MFGLARMIISTLQFGRDNLELGDMPSDEQLQHQSSGSNGRKSAIEMLARKRISVSTDPKREHKEKKIYVDPRTNLPLRPPTSFGLFKHELRKTKKPGEKVDFAQFNREAGEKWSALSDEEKAPYLVQARRLAERYKKIEAFYLRKSVRQLQKAYGRTIFTCDRMLRAKPKKSQSSSRK